MRRLHRLTSLPRLPNARLTARRGGAAAATPAYQQILNEADAAGAQAIWNADDPNTWTLRESGGTEFYSAIADEQAALPDLAQATEANQPDQVTLSTGARVAARTAGSARRMVTTAFTEISQPNTILVVSRLGVTGGASQRIFDPEGIGTARQLFGSVLLADIRKWSMWAGSFMQGSVEDTNWHIHQCNFNGASSELFLDGVSDATGDAGTNGLTGAAIMARNGLNDPMRDGGKVGLVIIFPTLKTNAELADLRAAIEDRYPIGVSE